MEAPCSSNYFDFAIVGGGIAAVSCAEQLAGLEEGATIAVFSASSTVKAASNVNKLGEALVSFEVEEREAPFEQYSNVTLMPMMVTSIDYNRQELCVHSGETYRYGRLALCTGAKPKHLTTQPHPHVLTIRDTDSVATLQGRLEGSKRIVIIGNGGIATELVHELRGFDVIWAIKHDSIAATFVDAGAARFFLNARQTAKVAADKTDDIVTITKRTKYIHTTTGVIPNVDLWSQDGRPLPLAEDGGIPVNEQLMTSQKNVFAGGDACTAAWSWSRHWQQMRLWTQARQFGQQCAASMSADARGIRAELDISFEIFTHVTNFFGFKVVLLGCFNGRGLVDAEALLRVRPGVEYVKLLVAQNRVQGAILVGDTELEDTMENLILNQTDISDIKDDMLNPSVDIEDYFD